MIPLAVILQFGVVVCLVIHFGKKEVAKQQAVIPGKTYEVIYEGHGDRPSSIYRYIVIAIKDGHVKYRTQGFELDRLAVGEDVKTIEDFLRYARPINLKANDPFSEEPKQ